MSKAISRALLGKIVDEVFDGAIEDPSVIEQIYAVIKREEAALSAAEPYAAMTIDYLGCEYLSRDVANIEKIAAAGSKGPTEVVYFFTAAPAPSVAVNALEWKDARGDGSFVASTMFGLLYIASERAWGFRNYPDLYPVEGGIEKAKAAAQADYETRIRSALSAQVQDVAERQPKEIATWEDQQAFEAWAQGERYEMHQHPLYYLFMDPKTNAARQGWKAALQFIRDRSAAAPAKQEGK